MRIFGKRFRPAGRAGGLLLLALLAPIGLTGTSQAEEAPAAFLARFSEQAIAVLADKSLSDQARELELRGLFTSGFDVPLIGRYVLGRHWRRASPVERDEFLTLFEDFVVATYARRLGGYSGETLAIGATRSLGEDRADVESLLNRPSGAPIKVVWRLHRRDRDWRIVDITVEGVSMAVAQRSEFASVVARHNGRLNGLLQALRQISRQNKVAAAE